MSVEVEDGSEPQEDGEDGVDPREVQVRMCQLVDKIRDCATLREVDRAYVAYALAFHGGNRMRTATRIGCDRRTIQRWTKERGEGRDA